MCQESKCGIKSPGSSIGKVYRTLAGDGQIAGKSLHEATATRVKMGVQQRP